MEMLTWSEVSHRVGQASSLHFSDEGTQSTSFSHLPSNHLNRRSNRSQAREKREEGHAESGGEAAATG